MADIKAHPAAFSISSRDEADRFQRLLNLYCEIRFRDGFSAISLGEAFDFLKDLPEGSRSFAAVLDIAINFVLLMSDSLESWSPLPSAALEGLKHQSYTVDQLEFLARMDSHRHSSAFVLRYRALWDKMLGLIVLLGAPEKYEDFFGAKSRKKEFAKIAREHLHLPDTTVEPLLALITEFDDTYRTAEAHGTGSLRKWSFIPLPPESNPKVDFLRYWNVLNLLVLFTNGIFDLNGTAKLMSADLSDAFKPLWEHLRRVLAERRGSRSP
jgi:hypothetical protein